MEAAANYCESLFQARNFTHRLEFQLNFKNLPCITVGRHAGSCRDDAHNGNAPIDTSPTEYGKRLPDSEYHPPVEEARHSWFQQLAGSEHRPLSFISGSFLLARSKLAVLQSRQDGFTQRRT